MPFVSKAQQRYMFATHPGIAKEMASKTPSFATLPEYVKGGGPAKVAKKAKGVTAAVQRRAEKMKGTSNG